LVVATQDNAAFGLAVCFLHGIQAMRPFDVLPTLSRILAAGLPLVAACSDEEPSRSGPGADAAVTPAEARDVAAPVDAIPDGRVEAACTPQVLIDRYVAPSSGRIAFDPRAPLWADLYEACVTQPSVESCTPLCTEIVRRAGARPDGGGLMVTRCELLCETPGLTTGVAWFTYPVPGRRPEGFPGGVATGPGTSVADWCADAAVMEGASIAAFARLARELEAEGAPAELVRRARRAASDEARHFRIMRDLAVELGGRVVERPRAEAHRPRPLFEVARENVVEGCVSESLAAVVAAWQAQYAANARIRDAMSVIAEDEASHAQLAWDVFAWSRDRLDGDETRALDEVLAAAGRSLVDGAAAPVSEVLVAEAGLPSSRAASALASAAFAELWSAAR
jgi:rubrerythrin